MISSIVILVFSTALFIFYVQTLCEKVLRREFSHSYFQDVLNSIDLEFPHLQQAIMAGVGVAYPQIQLALKSDYLTLKYLLKNGNPKQRYFSWHERLLISYFRILLLMLPVRFAFHFHEGQGVLKLTVILHHFANLVGERVISATVPGIAAGHQI
ncbi:MAG: hypothetical protein EPN47_08880 [Acidobacteria bacterium]|nr:MAG: hypothetical protein EPN47_08880 [Acidobacteriota bacterium]